MNKYYIHQLKDGKMLVLDGDTVRVEETGYPIPDCRLSAGSNVYKGQVEVMRAILGYSIEDHSAITEAFSSTEEITYNDFKLKIQSEDIGGGCPKRIQLVARDCTENGISYIQSLFKHKLPEKYLASSCELPCDKDLFEKYTGVVGSNWECKSNFPNQSFLNNIIMYLGVRSFGEKHLDFFKDLKKCCMAQEYKEIFRYLSVITAENGVSAVLLLDSVMSGVDLEYFYSVISKVDLADGNIVIEATEEGVEVSFLCLDESLVDYYKRTKPFRGRVAHYDI